MSRFLKLQPHTNFRFIVPFTTTHPQRRSNTTRGRNMYVYMGCTTKRSRLRTRSIISALGLHIHHRCKPLQSKSFKKQYFSWWAASAYLHYLIFLAKSLLPPSFSSLFEYHRAPDWLEICCPDRSLQPQ